MGSEFDYGIHRADGHQNDGNWSYNQTASTDARPCIAGSDRFHHGADSHYQIQGQSLADVVVHSGWDNYYRMDTR